MTITVLLEYCASGCNNSTLGVRMTRLEQLRVGLAQVHHWIGKGRELRTDEEVAQKCC